MTDRPRTISRSFLLHAVLIGGSIIFALPYVWLVGTSWKLDKEIQTEKITIFPQRPIPRPVSPYVDTRHFPPIEQPVFVGRHRWEQWMHTALEERLGQAVDEWFASGVDQRWITLDRDDVREQLIRGAFARLRHLLPLDLWEAPREVFEQGLTKTLQPQFITEAFDQCYRYFALGKVLVKNRDYRIFDLSEGRSFDSFWRVTRGPATLERRVESEHPVAVAFYNLTEADTIEITSDLELPFDFEQFKRLSLSLRRDQTWHELRLVMEFGGRRLESSAPSYLGEDTWWEVNFQEPSEDDKRLSARRYILLKETDRGSQYDHGDRRIKLRVTLQRSSNFEAFWAKGTENYRKAFDEVPFWQYFKTSIFLVIANILGTALSCSLAAFAFARLRWPGRDFCFVLVLATLMIPPQVTMIPSFVIYKYLGWYNTLAPLWVPNCLAVNAFAVFLLRQAMKGIPRDLEEAAQIDGCGWLRIYWNVALPLMKPTLAAISIFTFMFVWNDFMTPLIYVNDQRLYPLALGLFSFLAGRENQFSLIMAGSMIMTLPVIITFFFAQRHFIQGVTMTGMKN